MELREYNREKRQESEIQFQKKLKFIQQENDQKRSQINQKFKKLNSNKQALENSMYEIMLTKKEENAQKSELHNRSFQKIQRARSAYKAHLCNKIVDKGMRGGDIIAMRQSAFGNVAQRPLMEAISMSIIK